MDILHVGLQGVDTEFHRTRSVGRFRSNRGYCTSLEQALGSFMYSQLLPRNHIKAGLSPTSFNGVSLVGRPRLYAG